MKKTYAISVVDSFEKKIDIAEIESEILRDISKKTGFLPKKNIWRSTYWGKRLGASHWLGKLDQIDVVLKIQGDKPMVSEITVLKEIEKSNRSNKIHPPKLITGIPWKKGNGYEALILEYVSGPMVLQYGNVVSVLEIRSFLDFYLEYRKNTIPHKPWMSKPDSKFKADIYYDKLSKISNNLYPNHPLKLRSDIKLIKNGLKTLEIFYSDKKTEFVHSHLSCNDLKYEDEKRKNAVFFSNLFWRWQYPYYDLILPYHFFMYELHWVKNITPKVVDSQRAIWKDEIFKVAGVNKTAEENLLYAAFLERAIAGLIIDSFLVDSKKSIAEYLVESTRMEVIRFSKLLT